MSPSSIPSVEAMSKWFDKVHGVTKDQLVMEGTNWLTSKGFQAFEEKYPEHAAWLQEMSRKSTPLTILVFGVIGSVISNMFIKNPSSSANVYLSHFLTAARSTLQHQVPGKADNSFAAVLSLQKALLTVDQETSGPIIEWLSALNDEDRRTVYDLVGRLSADEVSQFFKHEEQVRLKIVRLNQQTSLIVKDQGRESELLKGLKGIESSLRKRAEGTDDHE